jgi:hypothetical protein
MIRASLSFNYTALKQTIIIKLFNFQINHIQLGKYLLRSAQKLIYSCKKHYKIKLKQFYFKKK